MPAIKPQDWLAEKEFHEETLAQIKQLLAELNDNLPIVLDFVERHNKQDKEQDVAEAAAILSEYV